MFQISTILKLKVASSAIRARDWDENVILKMSILDIGIFGGAVYQRMDLDFSILSQDTFMS